MQHLTSEIIREALSRVIDRDTGLDVVTSGMAAGITINGGKVSFLLSVDARGAAGKEHLRDACAHAVQSIPGVESVTAVLTAEAPPQVARKAAVWNTAPVENVRRIIAVASGKGGVGKSTLAAALAQMWAARGRSIGLLDADIYGPSLPRILGVGGKPEMKDGKMLPHARHGVQCMSVGFITGEDPAIFRGPMISKTLAQLLRSTAWGADGKPLDALLVDMPPGTGDVHLSLCQGVPLAGAIIVTTPQEVALLDARKALMMFLKLNVPVLGVIENMQGEVFGQGGGAKLAAEFEVPLLAEVALEASVRRAADAGEPLAIPALGRALAAID